MKIILPLIRPWLLTVCLCAWMAATASAQMSLEMSQLQLRYRVLKNSTKLDDAKSAALQPVEQAAQTARAKGDFGNLYRNLNHGIAILEGKPWSAREDYLLSLTVATDTTVFDPAQPLEFRLTQRYSVGPGELKLSARATIEPLAAANQGRARNAAEARSLGEFSQLPADLAATPVRGKAELKDLATSGYQLTFEISENGKVLRKVSAPVYAVQGFNARQVDFTQRLKKVEGREAVKASIQHPFDYARVINSGKVALNPFDFGGALTTSGELLAAIEAGKDPFAGKQGNLSRHYSFGDAGEIMPYRVYVPKSYDGSKAVPLIIALHGLGGTEMTFMQQGNGALPKLAEEKGFILATPLGYRRNGGYGRVGPPGTVVDSPTTRMGQLSEQDVMNVLRLVREQYQIDNTRIYLMGHSMGGSGTWNLGSKYADIWAAIAPIAPGSVSPAVIPLAKLKENHVPVLSVHGDADRTTPVETSRMMTAEMKKMAMDHEYIEVKGGTHGDVVGPNIPRIVEFFYKYQRGGTQ